MRPACGIGDDAARLSFAGTTPRGCPLSTMPIDPQGRFLPGPAPQFGNRPPLVAEQNGTHICVGRAPRRVTYNGISPPAPFHRWGIASPTQKQNHRPVSIGGAYMRPLCGIGDDAARTTRGVVPAESTKPASPQTAWDAYMRPLRNRRHPRRSASFAPARVGHPPPGFPFPMADENSLTPRRPPR